MENENKPGIDRRNVLKAAAWSAPAVAIAVATPLASASPTVNSDVAVTASCVGNYNLDGLFGLINAIPGIGAGVTGLVEGLLGAIGLTPFQSRGFTIAAAEGTVPAGTQFVLTTDPGLIDLSLLGGVLDVNVLNLVTINGDSSATIALVADLAEGESTTIQLPINAVDLGVTGNASLALVGADNPSTGAGQPNEAGLNLISVDTNLGSLIPLDDVPFLVRALVAAVTITVQLCPGQELPV